MFDVQIWQMIHHWKALVLYFQNLQKNLQICKNCTFFCKIQFYSKNVCKKKIVQKIKNYTFLKSPWPCHFKYAKIFANWPPPSRNRVKTVSVTSNHTPCKDGNVRFITALLKPLSDLCCFQAVLQPTGMLFSSCTAACRYVVFKLYCSLHPAGKNVSFA